VIRTPALVARASLAAVACALWALAAPAGAQLYDPAYRWRTLETPHFRIHFHQGEEELARLVASTAERAHAQLAPLLGYSPPTGTEMVLSDDSDEANGSATPVPYDVIRLYATPPPELSELNAYRDWITTLVFHEYVHILHLDHVEGFPHVLNRIFGKLFAPNGLTPSWLTEGLAVLHEADGDPGQDSGRNRSAIHAMYARSLALEPPGFPRLDQVSNPSLEWPVGTVPYLLGGRFLEFLQERSGDEVIAGYIARQGAQIWPYAPSHVGEPFFGAGFPELWEEYARREEARANETLARVRERPVTQPRRITSLGGMAGWPRWTADGKAIAYLRQDLDRTPSLLQVTPEGEPVGCPVRVEAGDGLSVSGGTAVLSRAEVYRGHRLYDDLWRVDLARGRVRRLTRGARASEPALSADGTWLVDVRRTAPGELALERRRADGTGEERLLEEAGAQVYAPAISPDGRRVAFALQQGGRRDLVVLLLDDGRRVKVTDDAAIDASPTFTPDGRWLLFSSDRGGIYNLFAWPVEECLAASPGPACALRQVTNVETGAFQPAVSPDGRTIALVSYSRAGYDLATLPFDPDAWLDPEPAPAPEPPPISAAPAAEATRPYDPLPTLLPAYWFPVLGTDPNGPIYGALTVGGDVLGRHAYALAAWGGVSSHQVGYSAAYLGGWSWPQVDVTSSRYLLSARRGYGVQSLWTIADAGLDFTFPRLEWAALVRVGWSGTLWSVRGDTARGTARRPEDLGRADAFGSQLTLRGSWSDAQRFVHSISDEAGRTLAVDSAMASRDLGSDFDLAMARASLAQYLRIPFTRHAVLALRLAGGAANGSFGTTAPFTLGGVGQPDVVALLLGSSLPSTDELRGYPAGWLEGTGFALANAEVRFPIATPELGHTTWPVFLRRIHGAVFADLGDAFDRPGTLPFAGHPFRTDELRLGAGLEARLELALGYFAVTDLRLGLAHAFGRVFHGESREPGVAEVTGYVVLGSAF
jgi:hypothetical protein